MAQLPPRAPSAGGQDWPVAGEFLGFAAARRGVHRRSASDPAAFLEAVPMDHILSGGGGDDEFDRLDDEQLMSMFSNVDGGCDRPGFMDTGEAEEGTPSAGAMAAADGFGDPKRAAAPPDGSTQPSLFLRALSWPAEHGGYWPTGSQRRGQEFGSCSTSQSLNAASPDSRWRCQHSLPAWPF
uniref:Uncharacterized protein n=1 Tax=Aegilops tauschii subsp. strangulata TaxID=200361 RepID=A0A453KCB3_AEGTS